MDVKHPFLERVERGPILCDGAMGTRLYTHGISYDRCFEELNLTDPELIKSIHLDYIAAGAEIIETNTFGATRHKLSDHGLEGKARQINRAGARIAREARDLSGRGVFLAGSIGPLGRPLAPVGHVEAADARAAFREQAEALLETGVDLFIVETMYDLAEMRAALGALRGITDLPIVAQMTFGEDGLTSSGDDPATIVFTLRDLGANLIGVNCALGPADTLGIVEAMRRASSDVMLSAQPNAGLPQRMGDRFVYMSTPEYFAEYTRRFLGLGVRLVGGCCGTTSAHIAAMSAVLGEYAPHITAPVPAPARPARIEVVPGFDMPERGAAPRHPTNLEALFGAGHFVVSAEMNPPRGVKFTKFLQNAEYLRDIGVDQINIPDNAMARVRMSNVAAARLIQQHAGVETLIHFTPRDRNLMAVQSDVIGAHATGIRNILAVTGDPPGHGDFPNATGNWDVDSIGLIAILSNLNQGLDALGRKLGEPASFFIGCAANPSAMDIGQDLERLKRKIEAGGRFVMTQPVYEAATLIDYFAHYTALYGPVPVPIMVGLQPLHSYRLAEKFHNEVPGIVIPDHIRERMRLAGENGFTTGLEITLELIEAVYAHVQGAYIMPLDRYDLVGALLPHIRALAPAA